MANLISIEVIPDPNSIPKGAEMPYTATGYYDDGSYQDITAIVTWSSNDEGIATVTPEGVVHGVDIGSTEITAIYDLITSNKAVIEVTAAVLLSWEINPDISAFPIGNTEQIVVKKVYTDGTKVDATITSCTSDHEDVATATNTALVTAISSGVTYININTLDDNSNPVLVRSIILVQPQVVPPGATMDYLAESDPKGWLICNGREISKTQYNELFLLMSPVSGPMYGSCGSSAEFYGADPENPSNIVRIRNLGTGTTPHDTLVGLTGFSVSTIAASDPQNTVVTCIAADSFDPSTGYIHHYGRSFNSNYLDWYIVFIKDNIIDIHPDVPVSTSNRIIYVNISSGDTAIEVGTALRNACNYIGFYLPDCRGLFTRIWNNGASIDLDASSRTGRLDGVSGDHVGTKQDDIFEEHTHDISVLGLWNGRSDDGLNAHRAPTIGDSSGSLTTDNYGYSVLTSVGGNETRPKNIYLAKIIKY